MEEKNPIKTDIKLTLEQGSVEQSEERTIFWNKAKHFYRTGEKPDEQNNQHCKSLFQVILNNEKSGYPFNPESGSNQQIDFDNKAFVKILEHVLNKNLKKRRELFREEIFQILTALEKILKIDPEFKVDEMEKTYGFANDLMAFDKMAKIVSRKSGKGSNIGDERSKRLKTTLEILKSGIDKFKNHLGTIILNEKIDKQFQISKILNKSELIKSDKKDPFDLAINYFNKEIKDFEMLVKANRIAQLEADSLYQNELHDDYFTHFTRHRFKKEEELLIQPIIIIVSYNELEVHMNSMLKLLQLNAPFKFIVLRNDLISQIVKEKSWEDAAHQYRQELSALAISHRNVTAFQSTIEDPMYLLKGFETLFGNPYPCIAQLLLNSETEDNLDAEKLLKSASLGRYFPKLIFDASRESPYEKMDLSSNIQENQNWPLYILEVDKDNQDKQVLEFNLTYADYKALFKSKRSELMLIPLEYEFENLCPLNDYLELEESDIYGKVPFIWLLDEKGQLRKAIVPNLWVVSCQERLDFWNFLQQFASFQKSSRHNSEIEENNGIPEQLIFTQSEFREKIKKIEAKSVQIAANKMILGLLGEEDIINSLLQTEPEPPSHQDKETDSVEIVSKVESNKEGEIKASLDTEDCTSCNECTDQYPNLFEYNDDKQAVLKDPAKGTFEQLVKAAEKCPAACIHPGAPLNPKEANLEKLIKRAEKFN
ncbi:MAG: ferredoxin [Cytophagales bacterium]